MTIVIPQLFLTGGHGVWHPSHTAEIQFLYSRNSRNECSYINGNLSCETLVSKKPNNLKKCTVLPRAIQVLCPTLCASWQEPMRNDPKNQIIITDAAAAAKMEGQTKGRVFRWDSHPLWKGVLFVHCHLHPIIWTVLRLKGFHTDFQ